MRPHVIGIAGADGAGKDTVADFIAARYGYERKSFAEPLRQMALVIDPIVEAYRTQGWVLGGARVERLASVVERVGWRRAKDEYPEVRRFLVKLGTDSVRDMIDPDAWVKLAGPWPQPTPTIFNDLRFDNEARFIHASRGRTIEIRRPGFDAGQRISSPDYVIHNVGTVAELLGKVERLLTGAG